MKNKMLKFFMVSDIIYQVITISILCLAVLFLLKGENLYLVDIMFITVLNYSGATGFSFMHYNRYMNFGFCRKRFYREQVLLSVVRGGIYALVRTALQIMYNEEYISSLTEGTSYTADMYSRASAAGMFLFNLGLFVLISLMLLVTMPCLIYPFISVAEEESVQIKYRRQLAKSRNPFWWTAGTIIVKSCGGIVIMGLSMLIGYAGIVHQLYSEGSFRRNATVVMLVLCIICILIGRRKFRPENI